MAKKRSLYWVVGILMLFIGVIMYLNQKTTRNPDLYLIPSGYVGLVTVNFEKTGAPALSQEGDFTVYVIPESGVLDTSSPAPQVGLSSDKFYYVDKASTRQELDQGIYIHGYSIGKDNKGQISQHLFVGTAQQYGDFVTKQEEKNKHGGNEKRRAQLCSSLFVIRFGSPKHPPAAPTPTHLCRCRTGCIGRSCTNWTRY